MGHTGNSHILVPLAKSQLNRERYGKHQQVSPRLKIYKLLKQCSIITFRWRMYMDEVRMICDISSDYVFSCS